MSKCIRDALAAQVERCMYVERVDAMPDDERATSDSFRKSKWLQQRALRLDSASAEEQQQLREQERQAADAREALRLEQQLAQELERAAAAIALRQKKDMRAREAAARANANERKRDASVPLAFEAFVDEIQLSDVDVSCLQSPLQVTPLDPLGAISVPSTREGNSLTLCCYEQALDSALRPEGEDDDVDDGDNVARNELLVVFGGRVLQDVSMLLPAAVQRDPMQFERVRYTYSNAVYVYDIATGVWQFCECTGRVPRARSDHTAVFVEPRSLAVIGGRGRNGQLFNDVVALDLVTWHWMHVDTDATMLERYWHACCVTDESVFVFGGKSEVLAHGDLQQLKLTGLCDALMKANNNANQLSSSAAVPASTTQARVAAPPPLSWICPHTVGKAPSPRFGMALVALDSGRIAVVGGYRLQAKKPAHHALQRPPRLMDVHILDTVTMIWSTPRLSSHVSALTAPTERMLFECFYEHATLIVFGGFTYATNGETESYTPRQDDAHVVYKLDVNRMIWRRQELMDSSSSISSMWLPPAHVHASANAVLRDRAFTCCASNDHTQLELAAFRIRPTAVATSIEHGDDRSDRAAPLEHLDGDDNAAALMPEQACGRA